MRICLTVFPATIAMFPMLISSFAAASEPTEKIDPKSLEGSWRITKAELSGLKLPDEVTRDMTLVLGDGTYLLKSKSPDDKGSVKLDVDKKEMDITGEEGPNKGKKFLAIFSVDGEKMTVCYDLEGKKRPTEFKTTKESKYFLVTYERISK